MRAIGVGVLFAAATAAAGPPSGVTLRHLAAALAAQLPGACVVEGEPAPGAPATEPRA